MKTLSLYQLNTLVREAIDQHFRSDYWVEAELSDATERRGHLYLNLIQKDDHSNTPIAQARAVCWANNWAIIRRNFQRITGQDITAGMKVLLLLHPSFHQAYGFQLVVTDIDATYTLGDMARRRQDIINTLKAEGVYDLQKQLKLPLFCQNIAVISSATAAGYGDFCNQLADNDHGYTFHTQLFPAIMQGEQVEQSIIAALDQIMLANEQALANHHHPSPNTPAWGSLPPGEGGGRGCLFDCVVIIRGGGATSDMSGFDTLALAENVANFSLPIITGIGHDRDESILDLISYHHVKTPTAAAAYLIDNLAAIDNALDDMSSRIVYAVQHRLEYQRVRLASLSSRLPILFSLVKTNQGNRLDRLMQRLSTATSNKIQREQHRIDLLAQRTASLDPQLILKRGYSMTLSAGHVVTDASQLADGEIIETRLSNGTIYSTITLKPSNS